MMTREEYFKNQTQAFKINNEWSEPLYTCPECNKGGMRKNLRICECVATMPPIYIYTYKCNKCNFTEQVESWN